MTIQEAPIAQPTLRGRLTSAASTARGALAGSPGRLRLLSALAVLAAVVFGAGSAQAFGARAQAMAAAEADAAQLVRLQAIHTDLVRSDAEATNAFLVGGLEPAERRTAYLSALRAAGTRVAEAAREQPRDADALGALNAELLAYAGAVESARANNRQGFPVGAQYLRQASLDLRADTLPIIAALVAANEQRVEDSLDAAGRAVWWLVLGGLLGLAGLGWAMVKVAQHSHRYLNPPLTVAALIALAGLCLAGVAMIAAGSQADQVRDGPYASALATAKARIAAFDAKANESLTLIARGSGQAYEEAAADSLAVAADQARAAEEVDRLADGLANELTAWGEVHQQIRAADEAGRWEEAVQRATAGADQPESSNAAFDAFDRHSAAVLRGAGAQISSGLAEPRGGLLLGVWLALIAGGLAAVSAWWGIALRLEEYR